MEQGLEVLVIGFEPPRGQLVPQLDGEGPPGHRPGAALPHYGQIAEAGRTHQLSPGKGDVDPIAQGSHHLDGRLEGRDPMRRQEGDQLVTHRAMHRPALAGQIDLQPIGLHTNARSLKLGADGPGEGPFALVGVEVQPQARERHDAGYWHLIGLPLVGGDAHPGLTQSPIDVPVTLEIPVLEQQRSHALLRHWRHRGHRAGQLASNGTQVVAQSRLGEPQAELPRQLTATEPRCTAHEQLSHATEQGARNPLAGAGARWRGGRHFLGSMV